MRNGSYASLRAVRGNGGKLNEKAFGSDANRDPLVEIHSCFDRDDLPAHGLLAHGEEAVIDQPLTPTTPDCGLE